ncbi:signal-regulatory protein beta-2-like [Lampris incognitus]|uniref:signal-regulatory protein beta-2-like n=1 Tax=Lampris incognitus TaxID=2546036 RepID=UPI0024B5550A|nr:signal-regulatory protein beta-2-like [Lampris incognitus]
MSFLLISLLLAAMCFECRAQKDNVLQPKGGVTVSEGETVTLDCHYNTSGSNTYLFWYRQATDDKPTFILSRSSFGSGDTADGFKERFDSSLDSSSRSVPLKIQSLQLSDSAVYYCALRLAAMCFECRAQKDNVLQPKGDVTVSEGETVTLDCHYNTSDPGASLYWYRQAADDKPTFILSRSSFGSGNTADGFKERFDSSLDSSSRSVPLKIQSLQLSDSAVYYCALVPVISKPSSPSKTEYMV